MRPPLAFPWDENFRGELCLPEVLAVSFLVLLQDLQRPWREGSITPTGESQDLVLLGALSVFPIIATNSVIAGGLKRPSPAPSTHADPLVNHQVRLFFLCWFET